MSTKKAKTFYSIAFDDGDSDDAVPANMVRISSATAPSGGPSSNVADAEHDKHGDDPSLRKSNPYECPVGNDQRVSARQDAPGSSAPTERRFTDLPLIARVRLLKALCDYHLYWTAAGTGCLRDITEDDLRVEKYGRCVA